MIVKSLLHCSWEMKSFGDASMPLKTAAPPPSFPLVQKPTFNSFYSQSWRINKPCEILDIHASSKLSCPQGELSAGDSVPRFIAQCLGTGFPGCAYVCVGRCFSLSGGQKSFSRSLTFPRRNFFMSRYLLETLMGRGRVRSLYSAMLLKSPLSFLKSSLSR